jgi:hypothetical protein
MKEELVFIELRKKFIETHEQVSKGFKVRGDVGCNLEALLGPAQTSFRVLKHLHGRLTSNVSFTLPQTSAAISGRAEMKVSMIAENRWIDCSMEYALAPMLFPRRVEFDASSVAVKMSAAEASGTPLIC